MINHGICLNNINNCEFIFHAAYKVRKCIFKTDVLSVAIYISKLIQQWVNTHI